MQVGNVLRATLKSVGGPWEQEHNITQTRLVPNITPKINIQTRNQ